MSGGWTYGVIRSVGAPPAGTVVKFGGSLLRRSTWPQDLRLILAAIPGGATVVVGGGAVVDALRAIDASCPRPVDDMDRLAIEAMGLTARLVAAAIDLPVAGESERGETRVLDASAWLARHRHSFHLPVGWGVTSDSIAAAVAAAEGSSLMLAKSVPPRRGAGIDELSREGWVDEQFPVVSAAVGWIAWAAPEAITPTSTR